jgi:Ca2+-binding RTX toxin-like protein
MKQGILLSALLLVAGLTMAGPAGAADRSVTVAVGAGGGDAHASALQLGVTGSPQADEISVTLDGTQTQFVITSTRPINPPPPPCVQISTSQVHCPTSEFVSFSATLGDGNDAFSVGPSVAVPVSLTGGSGRDKLTGGSGSDTVTGGIGRDRLVGRNGRDTLNGGKGGDVEIAGEGRDTLMGGKGGDVLKGGKGRDVLQGGKGRDVLQGGPGSDVEKQ